MTKKKKSCLPDTEGLQGSSSHKETNTFRFFVVFNSRNLSTSTTSRVISYSENIMSPCFPSNSGLETPSMQPTRNCFQKLCYLQCCGPQSHLYAGFTQVFVVQRYFGQISANISKFHTNNPTDYIFEGTFFWLFIFNQWSQLLLKITKKLKLAMSTMTEKPWATKVKWSDYLSY